MSTITISLPSQITKRVDIEAKNKGFATRSEFIRSLIRRHFGSYELTFEPYNPRSLEEIEEGLRKTGKYNESFIKSVVAGLGKSSVYENKTS